MKRILIDTHVLLWWLAEPERLQPDHVELLEDPENTVEVSVCSLFEITIKKSVGKLVFNENLEDVLNENGFDLLPINFNHLHQYGELPEFHKDPFDRMLIAQAISEQIPVISYDTNFKRYGVNLL